MTRAFHASGFTLIEAMVTVGMLMAIVGATFQVLAPSQGLFRVQPEVSAVHQRLRVGLDALAADLRMAGAAPSAGPLAGGLAAVVPPVAAVAARGSTDARDDAVSIVAAPEGGAVGVVSAPLPAGTAVVTLAPAPCQGVRNTVCGFREDTRVLVADATGWEPRVVVAVGTPASLVLDRGLARGYVAGATVVEVAERAYRLAGEGDGASLVRSVDGGPAQPIVDGVVSLRFDYFDDAGRLATASLGDGPWAAVGGPWAFDVDLLRVRHVRVTLRAQAAAEFRGPGGPLFVRPGTATRAAVLVPDREVGVEVALRNMGP